MSNYSESEYHRIIRNAIEVDSKISQMVAAIKGNVPGELLDIFMPGVMYILDFKSQKYLYISDSCQTVTGYTKEEMYQFGTSRVYQLIHPEDRKNLDKQLGLRLLRKIKSISNEDLPLYRFSQNYRFLRSDGQFIQVLAQYSIALRDDQNNPVLAVGIFSDVSSFKKDDVMRMQLTRYSPETPDDLTSEIIFESVNPIPISSRELEILSYISKGQSNAHISEKLNISVFTVRAHRRNILKKTGCETFAQVISKARDNHWL